MSDRHVANLARLARLRGMVGKASPLPWWDESGIIHNRQTDTHTHPHACRVESEANTALIVAAVNALPAVLDDIEARLTQHARTTSPVGGVSGSADHLFIHACRTCRNPSPCADYLAAEALLTAIGGQ